MRILGIGLSHCCGVCLIEDDRIVFAQEEDRFSRWRRHKGWPEMSLSYLMEKFNLSESDIDLCVMTDIQTAERLKKKINARKTIIIHHHLAHIMSGWAMIGWPDFNTVSLDGGGDYGSWLSFGAVRDRKLINWESNCGSRLDRNNKTRRGLFQRKNPGIPFGKYWSLPAVVNFGMVDYHGIAGYEGKLMGLAAHGDPGRFDRAQYDAQFEIKKMSDYYYIKTRGHPKIGDKKFCITPDGKKISLAELRRLRKQDKIILAEYDLDKEEDKNFAADFAALLQDKTMNIVKELFEKNFDPSTPVVVSGGTFSNVLCNGMLNQKYKLFVTPPMGDDGLSLGAAAWGAYISGIKQLRCPGMYLGFDAGSNDDVNTDTIAEILVEKKIVGLIHGRMEFGPRALGARTILSDPQDDYVNWTINERLGRVEYMPFAPVIMEEYAGDVLIGWDREHLSSKHMTLVYQVNPKWRDRLRGVVHVDGTVRPQVLSKEDNPVYYDILYKYFKRTGIPVLINTSFNAHGEPMLRTVDEGIDALQNNRIDVLVAGNRIIYGPRKHGRSYL